MSTTNRVFNFSAGPAVLPLPVLEEAQRDMIALPGVGMSILEISHRSGTFESIFSGAIGNLRDIAGVPENYKILMLQGGASLQFSMVPMNLLLAGTTADYIDTGAWSKKAIKEARRVGSVHVVATTAADNYNRIPSADELTLSPDAAYVHLTGNNTIAGTEWASLPDVGDRPIVNDASSHILSGPVDISRYGMIYAGAQKNLGPSGVTLVIIREDLLERTSDDLPAMLSYRTHVDNDSRFNTPNTFGVYILGLTLKWLIAQGGLSGIAEVNARKAGKLYAEIDRTGFYRGTAEKASRSRMNVTFRLGSEEAEKSFIAEATGAGFDGLKGHRSVGGMRASIYNAFPEAGVDALVDFVREFERSRG